MATAPSQSTHSPRALSAPQWRATKGNRLILLLVAGIMAGSLDTAAQPMEDLCIADDTNEETRIVACSDVIAAFGAVADAAYAYNNRGAALQRLGEVQAAVADFEMAILLDPAAAIPYNNLGLALAAIGDFERAADRLYRAIYADPGYGAAHYHLVMVLLIQDRVAAALDAAEEAGDLSREGFGDWGEGIQRLLDGYTPGQDLAAEVAKEVADTMRGATQKIGD